MAGHHCESCAFRAKYDNKPKSILGKLWRWHAHWCPGWRAYMKSLPDEERRSVAGKYNLKKYM